MILLVAGFVFTACNNETDNRNNDNYDYSDTSTTPSTNQGIDTSGMQRTDTSSINRN